MPEEKTRAEYLSVVSCLTFLSSRKVSVIIKVHHLLEKVPVNLSMVTQ